MARTSLESIPSDWVAFQPPKVMSDVNWERFVAMIGEKEFVILGSSDGEDVQGYWVQHRIAISPQGISNLRRCSEVLALVGTI